MLKPFLQTITSILVLICLSQLTFGQKEVETLIASNLENGRLNYTALSKNTELFEAELLRLQNKFEVNGLETATSINYYNLLVIYQILEHYPIQSVEQVKGFFTKPHKLGPNGISLNALEKELIDSTKDPRIHFALNCGATGCPELSPIFFTAKNLDEQLDKLSKKALGKTKHLLQDRSTKQLSLSQIFKWYRNDFKDQGLVDFLNQYLKDPIDKSYTITYLDYDWSLNDQSGFRYYATNLYEKGEFEIQWFNNYYTQKETGLQSEDNFGRYNFFTSLLNTTIGLSNKVNLSLGIRFRSVNQSLQKTDGLFDALKFKNDGITYDQNTEQVAYSRTGVSAIYPGVKYSPFEDKPNISLYHAIHIPIGNSLEGNDNIGFLDWENITIQNNLYYTKDISENQVLFVDIGLLFENVGTFWFNDDNGFSQIGTPVTMIYSFFPNYKFSYYGLINLAPRIAINFDVNDQVKLAPFGQIGGGVKYFISKNLEAELLYTFFYDGVDNRLAHTFNIGFRYYGI